MIALWGLVVLICRNVKRFRGGLVFEAHRPVYHSTLGSRGIKKRRRHLAEVGDAL
jgi:hypothetical protein